jgi:uncharacterized protein (TIGR03435 family)
VTGRPSPSSIGRIAPAVFRLTKRPDRPGVDTTDLEGVYHLELKWAPDDAKGADSSAPSVFTAIQEQLGLKLEARKMPIDVLVVDHAEKVPLKN